MGLSTDQLARVCEQAEAEHIAAQLRAFAKLRPEAGAQLLPFAGGIAVLSAPELGHKLNRVTAAGIDEPLTDAALEELERPYEERETALEIDLCLHAHPRSTTLPAVRSRGVQRALLAHRVHRARALGARIASVAARPGTTSASNTERAGLRLVFNKPTFRRPGDLPRRAASEVERLQR